MREREQHTLKWLNPSDSHDSLLTGNKLVVFTDVNILQNLRFISLMQRFGYIYSSQSSFVFIDVVPLKNLNTYTNIRFSIFNDYWHRKHYLIIYDPYEISCYISNKKVYFRYNRQFWYNIDINSNTENPWCRGHVRGRWYPWLPVYSSLWKRIYLHWTVFIRVYKQGMLLCVVYHV